MTKRKAKTPSKPSAPAKKYALSIAFTDEELARLEAMERKRGLRRTPLLKMLLKDEANRQGIP